MKVRATSDLARAFSCDSFGLRYQCVPSLFPFEMPVFSLHTSECVPRYTHHTQLLRSQDMSTYQARAIYPSQAGRQYLVYCSASALPASLRFARDF